MFPQITNVGMYGVLVSFFERYFVKAPRFVAITAAASGSNFSYVPVSLFPDPPA